MAMAANLTEAANLTYDQLSLAWLASTIQAKYAAFITALQPAGQPAVFRDSVPNDRPVGNWLPLMAAVQSQMDVGVLPQDQFNAAVDHLYRMCLGAASALANGLITNTQATAMLNAWNAQFGT